MVHGAESQLPEDLSFHEQVDSGNAQQAVEFRLGDLQEYPLLELQEQPRDGEEQSGTGPVQVRPGSVSIPSVK